MQKLLTTISDLIFPPSNETKLLRNVDEKNINRLYQPSQFSNINYLANYTEPIIKAAIHENKFHHNPLAATVLGKIIARWHQEQTTETIYLPIPLGRQRLRERGHNQVTSMLKNCPQKLTVEENLVFRKTETVPQTSLSKHDRIKNMQDVFSYTGQPLNFAKDTQLVIIDDVVTTGSTLEAARTALQPHLPPNTKIICLALAH